MCVRASPDCGSWLDRQKAALHGNILSKVCHAALSLQLPILQHISAVGHEFGEVDVLLGQYDRQAFPVLVRREFGAKAVKSAPLRARGVMARR